MKIAVIGGAGQLGFSLLEHARQKGHETLGTYNRRTVSPEGTRMVQLDKSAPVGLRELFADFQPDVVVDTAALRNVDYCELHADEAMRINRDATALIAEAGREAGATDIFVSTDFVFGDRGHPPFTEAASPNPLSVYGRSKLAGEQLVLATNASNAVVRPSVIYSWIPAYRRADSSSGKGLNFGTWLVEEVAQNRPVRIVNDQIASPTLADDLAVAILSVAEHHGKGVFHAAGSTPLNRYEFSRQLVGHLGLDSSLVHPISTKDLKQTAHRPRDSSLESNRLRRETGHSMLPFDAQLDRFRSAYQSTRVAANPD